MAALSRIYLVSHRNGPPRLVEAHHPANALRYVAADEFRVEVASQQDLVDLVSAGTKVERVRAEAGPTDSPTHVADSEGGEP